MKASSWRYNFKCYLWFTASSSSLKTGKQLWEPLATLTFASGGGSLLYWYSHMFLKNRIIEIMIQHSKKHSKNRCLMLGCLDKALTKRIAPIGFKTGSYAVGFLQALKALQFHVFQKPSASFPCPFILWHLPMSYYLYTFVM